MAERFDVVVVGGGTGGSSTAAVLARAGKRVLVLERQVTFRDRVRGEAIPPWGVVPAQAMGVVDVLMAAGGTWQTNMLLCDELVPGGAPGDLTRAVPGVPGILDVGHPEACEAVLTLAEKEGAVVRRGVGDVEVTLGPSPKVEYEWAGDGHEAACRLVVGADGRQSSVRKILGLELESTPVWSTFGGMLVDEVEGWPSDCSALGTEGDLHFLIFPREGGKARLYLGHEPGQHPELTGAGKERAFLDAYRFACIPGGECFTKARPAGPAAFFPSRHTGISNGVPYGEGAVLVGDAAGWSDPIIGQGISISFSDAHGVTTALLATDDWEPGIFADYAAERAERMRRIRLSAMAHSAVWSDFTPAGEARRAAWLEATGPVAKGASKDPGASLLFLLAAASVQVGPSRMPAAVYADENVDALLNLGQSEPVPEGRWPY